MGTPDGIKEIQTNTTVNVQYFKILSTAIIGRFFTHISNIYFHIFLKK